MKKVMLIFLIIMPFHLLSQQMNIITFNIRYNNQGDGKNAWPNRIDMVNGLLRFHDPDIFGLQEALYGQITDIANVMEDYHWFGVGRDDGKKGGEFSPVFYKKDKFILLDKGHFWLSETPNIPSIGWDAAYERIVTWGKFRTKDSEKEFLFFNTHFDHIGVEARKNSARLIIEKIEEINSENNLPVILTGDFNLAPDEKPIIILKDYFRDTRESSLDPPYGPVGTFSGFNINAELDRRIDYIFVRGDIKVLKYAALTDWKNQRYPSDHLPVFAKIRIQ